MSAIFYVADQTCQAIVERFGESLPTIDYYKKIFPKKILSNEEKIFKEVNIPSNCFGDNMLQIGYTIAIKHTHEKDYTIYKIESVCLEITRHLQGATGGDYVANVLLSKLK